jgi:putative transferase (TIGR04331 family)
VLYSLVLNNLKFYKKKNYYFLNKLLERKYKKKNINYKTFNYKNINFKSREKINKKIYLISERLIEELSIILNEIHETKFSKRSWKIIIGPWINYFVTICWNRFYKIKKVLKNPNLDSTVIFECPKNFLALENNLHMFKLCNNDDWNSILYSQILLFLRPDQKYKKIILKKNFENSFVKKSFIKIFLSKLLNFFKKDTDALIVGSYLPFKEMLWLHFYLKQLPQLYSYTNYEKSFLSRKNLREKIILNEKRTNNFEIFLARIIPVYFPKCHLENFSSLKKQVYNYHFPKNPKFIFTSNNYEFDEIFKLFTAIQIKKKTKYIIGQHGNISWIENQFFNKIYAADYYLNWGKDGFGRHQDGFNFKLTNHQFSYDKSGPILILDSPFGSNNKIYDRIEQNFIKEDLLYELLNLLKKQSITNIVIKLHSSSRQRDVNYVANLKSSYPNLAIVNNDKKIFSLMKEARCVIHTYDSTGILESMSLNIPTFCIWPYGLSHVQRKFHRFYLNLKKNKILYFSSIKMVETISNHYQHLDKWWLSKKNSKEIFLKKFSIYPAKDSTKRLANKLIDLSKS